jgi:hypothetical protein
MDLKTIQETREYLSDKGCCAVVATAVAFDIDFKESQQYYDNAGRRRRTGTSILQINRVVDKLKLSQAVNVEQEKPTIYTNGKTMTAGNCIKYLDDDCNYIALTSGHALGIREGKVEDWTAGRRHRITKLYKVTRRQVSQAVKVTSTSDVLNELNELMSKF